MDVGERRAVGMGHLPLWPLGGGRRSRLGLAARTRLGACVGRVAVGRWVRRLVSARPARSRVPGAAPVGVRLVARLPHAGAPPRRADQRRDEGVDARAAAPGRASDAAGRSAAAYRRAAHARARARRAHRRGGVAQRDSSARIGCGAGVASSHSPVLAPRRTCHAVQSARSGRTPSRHAGRNRHARRAARDSRRAAAHAGVPHARRPTTAPRRRRAASAANAARRAAPGAARRAASTADAARAAAPTRCTAGAGGAERGSSGSSRGAGRACPAAC